MSKPLRFPYLIRVCVYVGSVHTDYGSYASESPDVTRKLLDYFREEVWQGKKRGVERSDIRFLDIDVVPMPPGKFKNKPWIRRYSNELLHPDDRPLVGAGVSPPP